MDASSRSKTNRRWTQMDADRISERRLRELTVPYLRPFGSIRGWFCFGLFSVSLADGTKGAGWGGVWSVVKFLFVRSA